MTIKSKLAVALVCVSLTGCQTYDPYTGESKTSKATAYGIGAAIVCGLIGAGESGKRARNAAAGCGAIGAGVGAYMDSQEKELRDELMNTGVQVERDGENIHLIMPNKITFETDRFDLQPSFEAVLNSVTMVLNKFPDTNLKVVGHTDSVGAAAYNQELSTRRAESVAGFLRSRNVDPMRLTVMGAGETAHIASNDSAEGRAMNRRVELSIIPKAY